MVHHPLAQGEGQNHQGCISACAGAADEDVQLSRVQRFVGSPSSAMEAPRLTGRVNADSKIVYRRYASLFFIAGCASTDNELITLEIVHRYVEQMDKYYGNVCEVSPFPKSC